MSGSWLDPTALRTLAALMESLAVKFPPDAAAMESMGFERPERFDSIITVLIRAGADRFGAARVLRELADELGVTAVGSGISFVASGPRPIAGIRETAAVMEMLFTRAERHLLVVGYALHQGERVLRTLAERMDANPGLEVILCLDIARQLGDTSICGDVLARWATRFRRDEWPGRRHPIIYYDPRALLGGGDERASLHAKCVVADRRDAFVTSANLTVAALERNIEFGVLIEQGAYGNLVTAHFDALIRDGHLCRLSL